MFTHESFYSLHCIVSSLKSTVVGASGRHGLCAPKLADGGSLRGIVSAPIRNQSLEVKCVREKRIKRRRVITDDVQVHAL